jgi:hypothetical protein
MFQFKNHPLNIPFEHNKLFTLEWQSLKCKWLLIHYVNNEKKRWYKRTERPYRFRRWFFRKATGNFSNLANFHSQKIEVYLFKWYISWPRKITIPLIVKRLIITKFPIHISLEQAPRLNTTLLAKPLIVGVIHPSYPNVYNNVSVRVPELNIFSQKPPNFPLCD